MEQIVNVLHEAAVEGSIPSLLDLLDKDRLILDRCMVVSYGETPLHIAAMLGHFEFCIELLRRKPELAEELDSRRSSALHLASAKGFTDIVKLLVSVRPKMSFAYDENGKNPIHVAAMKGRVAVLKELLETQPDAALRRVEMCQGETVLHLCVQYSQLEALRFLVENINDEQLLNAKDDNGNSILHLAVSDRQVQIINYLVQNTKIDVEAENSSGLTALDILGHTRRDSKYIDIAHCLHNYPPQSSKEISSSPQQESKYPSRRYQKLFKSKSKNKTSTPIHKSGRLSKKQISWLEKQRNSLMVVASLIATMGFQAALTPPGGIWQQDLLGSNNSSTNNYPQMVQYKAGNSIMADQSPEIFKTFMTCNTIGFISSLSVILLLTSSLPFTRKVFMWFLVVIMWFSISAIGFTYYMVVVASVSASENAIIDRFVKKLPVYIICWFMVAAFLYLTHTIHLVSQFIRSWSSKRKVFLGIPMTVLLILITTALSYFTIVAVHNKHDEDDNQSLNLLLLVIQGWLDSLFIFWVGILAGVVLIIVKKLIGRIKGVMICSRNQDSLIVV